MESTWVSPHPPTGPTTMTTYAWTGIAKYAGDDDEVHAMEAELTAAADKLIALEFTPENWKERRLLSTKVTVMWGELVQRSGAGLVASMARGTPGA